MGQYVPDSIVDRIRRSVDIVALVGETVPLKRAGSTYKGLCPFHREKTPSFIVTPERQTFKCFGCGEGGDVFSFVMKTENVSFPEALEILAERTHIELPRRGGRDAGASRDEKSLLFRANAWAADWFHKKLIEEAIGRTAAEYLSGRGVTPEIIERFQLGYAPDHWSALMEAGRAKGIPLPLMAKAGLLSSSQKNDRQYDRFRNRLMFPIRDVRNRVIGFGARALDDSEPKYLNSPETPLFSKGRTFYGLDRARETLSQTRRAVVVEGYMDVIAAHQHGLTGVIGVLGTALTREHARLLRRYADETVLLFDADNAGQSSANRSIDAFAEEELSVRVVTLPDGQDPDEFVRANGAEAFESVLESGVEGLDYKLKQALATVPEHLRNSAPTVARALDDVLATVARMPNAVTRSLAVGRIAGQTGILENALQDRLARLQSGRRVYEDEEETRRIERRRDAERELLEAMLTYPDVIGYVCPRLPPESLKTPAVRELVTRLYELVAQDQAPAAETLLARTREPEQRAVLEAIIGGETKRAEAPEAWCRELIEALQARTYMQAAAEAREKMRTLDADNREAQDRLLAERLQAARDAQRSRGRLDLKQEAQT